MDRQGILTVVSGFSGAGKGTVMKELLKKYDYSLSISATTRKPREGEVHGNEYFFLNREKFEDMIKNNDLIEWAEYVNNYYGTPKAYVEKQLSEGKDVILEIEIQGALKVKEIFPDSLLLFITPPTSAELKSRLINRGTEDIETINSRLNRALEESDVIDSYDYIIVNDILEDCVELVNNVIQSQHCKVSRNNVFIDNLKNELNAFKKGDN